MAEESFGLGNLQLVPSLRTFTLIAIILVLSNTSFSQLPKELESAKTLIDSSQAISDAERAAVLKKVVGRLAPYAKEDKQVSELVSVLELQAEWLQLDYFALYDGTKRAVAATDPAVKRAEYEKVRLELLQRAAFVMGALDPTKLSAEDARGIATVMQTASKALDEASSPSILDSKSSTFTKLLSLGNGFLKLKNSVNDPNAKDILDGMNNTVGLLESKLARLDISVAGPFKAFALPSAMVGGTNEQIMRASKHITAAMSEMPDTISGDPGAEKRLKENADEVGRILSPYNLGKAMLGALTDQAFSQIPFFGTIRNWFFTEIPSVDRRLGLRVNCVGTPATESQPIVIMQKLNRIVAVTDSATGCYPKGEVLFEGVHQEGNVYSVVIYRIWDHEQKKALIRGRVVVQSRAFVRMQAPNLNTNSSVDTYYLIQ